MRSTCTLSLLSLQSSIQLSVTDSDIEDDELEYLSPKIGKLNMGGIVTEHSFYTTSSFKTPPSMPLFYASVSL